MADNKNTVQDEADIITLEFEDGVTIECEVMGTCQSVYCYGPGKGFYESCRIRRSSGT